MARVNTLSRLSALAWSREFGPERSDALAEVLAQVAQPPSPIAPDDDARRDGRWV